MKIHQAPCFIIEAAKEHCQQAHRRTMPPDLIDRSCRKISLLNYRLDDVVGGRDGADGCSLSISARIVHNLSVENVVVESWLVEFCLHHNLSNVAMEN